MDGQAFAVLDPDHRFALQIAPRLRQKTPSWRGALSRQNARKLTLAYAGHGVVATGQTQQDGRRATQLAIGSKYKNPGVFFIDNDER